jgi:hypothetical protein
MKTLFKTQYKTAKGLVEKINENMEWLKKLSKYDDATSKENAQERYNKASKLVDFLAVIIGKECTIYLDCIYVSSFTINAFDFQKSFDEYEHALLEAGLIEYGDTLTDEQKLAYYHQQELQQLHQQEFECQF